MKSLALIAALAGCGDNLASPLDAPPIDAAPPDISPVVTGVVDGRCTGIDGKPRVLVYTYENQWRHESNYTARYAIYDMCVSRGFNVDTSNDPKILNAQQLGSYDVVVFSITSGIGVPEELHPALETWVAAGGGVVGLHSADSTEENWPFYVKNVGAQFLGHVPGMQAATVRVVPAHATHPVLAGITDFPHTDEWYFFQTRPETFQGMDMLLTLDEDTLPSDYPAMYKQGYHPIAWAHELYGGRMFYTAMGHNPDSFSDPTVLEIVGRAIEWAAHQR